jgi:hypothetical protein
MEINKKQSKKVKKDRRPPPRVKKNQNGKGDSPRNVSPGFRNNYEKIRWEKS